MLAEAQDTSIITRDVNGVYHFNGQFRNFHGVSQALEALKTQPRYANLVDADFDKIKALFEETFHHDEFTGRSGTFFAYEGLGSVYWHMVAKLLLAVQETVVRAREEACVQALIEKYAEIRQGLSFNKSPEVYGAFPTDPYSHTPKGQGAKQPGMTGLVKEVILTRLAEVGLFVENGCLAFNPLLLDKKELLTAPTEFDYLDVSGQPQRLELTASSLAVTFCQVPIILRAEGAPGIRVHFNDGTVKQVAGLLLDASTSRQLFQREGAIHHLEVTCPVSA